MIIYSGTAGTASDFHNALAKSLHGERGALEFCSSHPVVKLRVSRRRCLFEDGGEAGKHIIDDVFGDGFEELPLPRR